MLLLATWLVYRAALCTTELVFVSALLSYVSLNYTIPSLNFIHKGTRQELQNGSFHLKSPQKSAKLNGSDPDFDESAYIWSL